MTKLPKFAAIIVTGTILAGCNQTTGYWTHKNFNSNRFNEDKFSCERESYGPYPINNRLRKFLGDYETVDVNEAGRYEFWKHCMMKKGYYRVAR